MPDSIFAEYQKLIAKLTPLPPAITLLVDEIDGNGVELILDTSVPFYGEWIKGEGGDICLYRSRETDKVVGCYLPLMQKRLRVCTIGEIEFEKVE